MVEIPVNISAPSIEHLWQGSIFLVAALIILGGVFSTGDISSSWFKLSGGVPPSTNEVVVAGIILIATGPISRIIQEKLSS